MALLGEALPCLMSERHIVEGGAQGDYLPEE